MSDTLINEPFVDKQHQVAMKVAVFHSKEDPLQSVSVYVAETAGRATWTCLWNHDNGDSEPVADGWAANLVDGILIATQAGELLASQLK